MFRTIAPNIEIEESNIKTDDTCDTNDVQYSLEQFLDYLIKAADMFKLGDRLEVLPEIYKLSIGIYERDKNFGVSIV